MITITPRPLYIFDLDGTLCDNAHRRPLLADLDNKQRWKQFHDRCALDTPTPAVLAVMRSLMWTSDVWFWSGRPSWTREVTLTWLAYWTPYMRHEVERTLRVRDVGDDSRADDEVKREWWERFTLKEDQERLVAVFDDRDRLVQMWRSMGVACFQVAPGAF